MEPQTCIACSQVFIPTNRKHKHCSNTCVVRLHRLRKTLHLILAEVSMGVDRQGLDYLSSILRQQKTTQKEIKP